MKKILLALFFLPTLTIPAQKIKEKTLLCNYFQYPMKPLFLAVPSYSYYITELPDEFNGNKAFMHTSKGHIDTKYDMTMNGFLYGMTRATGLDSGQLRLSIFIGPFAIEKRNALYASQQNQQDMGFSMTYSYDIDFSLPMGVWLKTKDGRVVYHDSINPKTLYHSNYPVSMPRNLGDGLSPSPGYITQLDLENNFLKQRGVYLRDMKDYFCDQAITGIKNTLNNLYTYTYTRKALRFYSIKSKNGRYADLDTAMNIMESACDSISAHSKKMDYRNWNTEKIQKMISNAVAIWERDLQEGENKPGSRFTNEHVMHLKHNLMYGYYFLNDFANVKRYWEQVHNYSDWGYFHKNELDEFYKSLDSDELRYKANKESLGIE